MEENKEAVDGAEKAAAQDDGEARIAALETEKAKLIEERDNYKMGLLKEKAKKSEDDVPDEDERMERIARKTLADSRLAEIAREQDAIIKQSLKENKELKAALLNKKEPPAASGTHSEGQQVRDTSITPEQMAYFKAKNWTDKDIERYKRNLAKRI